MSTCEPRATLEPAAVCPRGSVPRSDQEVLWSITKEHVADFCDANNKAPLSDVEMEELRKVLVDDFYSDEYISEAFHRLRGGTRQV